jgi:pimeloyl-ACP methyl ester carboxylesterase
VTVHRLRLRYWDIGDGPAVVLVHGIGASVEYWRFTIEALRHDFRVIALDLPGCGKSERGTEIPTLAETADLLIAFLDQLGLDRASFIGNSMGGLVCLETALRHPERLDCLVLSSSAGLGREVSFFWRLVTLPVLGPVLIDLNVWLASRELPNFFYRPQGSEPEIIASCQEWVTRPDLTRTIVSVARMGVDLGGQRPEILRLEQLKGLKVPTLVVWGTNDWIIPPSHGKTAHRLIPGARLALLDRCGHCPSLESPQAFNQVTWAFLREEAPPALATPRSSW